MIHPSAWKANTYPSMTLPNAIQVQDGRFPTLLPWCAVAYLGCGPTRAARVIIGSGRVDSSTVCPLSFNFSLTNSADGFHALLAGESHIVHEKTTPEVSSRFSAAISVTGIDTPGTAKQWC